MEALLQIGTLCTFIFVTFGLVANKYDKGKERIKEHEAKGDITVNSSFGQLIHFSYPDQREYAFKIMKDGETINVKTTAQNFLSAKLNIMREYKVSHLDISI